MTGTKKTLYGKASLLLFALILLAGLTGCSESIESRQERVQRAVESALSAFDIPYELNIKSNEQNNYTTDKGGKTYYYFNVYIESNASLSSEEIFNIITAVDAVTVSHTSIYRFYTFAGDSYYIQDECILICGHDYDVAYTPIAQKQAEELTYSEKQAICNWLEDKYELYDLYDGKYSGDKYSDTLFEFAAQVFNMPVAELEIIWVNRYTN